MVGRYRWKCGNKLPAECFLAAVVFALVCSSGCDRANSTELQEVATCTSAVLSIEDSQVTEEDVLGVLGGVEDFYCCQRQSTLSSSCILVSQARYFFNGNPINTSDVAKYNTRNEDGAELIVLHLAPADQGRYTCACPGADLPPKDPEDEGIVLLCESLCILLAIAHAKAAR